MDIPHGGRPYKDTVALVTGASSGIGREVARMLAGQGATVIAVARRKERLDALVAEIAAAGGSAHAIACDVTSEPAVKEMAAAAKAISPVLHLVVNAAGRELVAPLAATKMDAARAVLDVNVIAVALVTKSCLALLKKGSAVVNIASASGMQGQAGLAIYAASKGAVIAMTRSLAREFAPRGIRVNAVAPGMVRTDMLDRMGRTLGPDKMATIEAAHPLGFGTVEDVAAAVMFLGGDGARWITGQTLAVDGGLTA